MQQWKMWKERNGWRDNESFEHLTDMYIEARQPLFPRAMSHAAALVRIFGECREGQIPVSLLRGF